MRHTDLMVWQRAMELVEKVYVLSKQFPSIENFALTTQLRRAAVSIPSNIAEGHGRKITKVYLNHLSIALGSLAELETQLRIACRLGYMNEMQLNPCLGFCDEVGKMLTGLMGALKKKKSFILPLFLFILHPSSFILSYAHLFLYRT